jgi:hypothetical protein
VLETSHNYFYLYSVCYFVLLESYDYSCCRPAQASDDPQKDSSTETKQTDDTVVKNPSTSNSDTTEGKDTGKTNPVPMPSGPKTRQVKFKLH